MKPADFTWIVPNTRWFGKRYWNHIPYVEGLLTAVLRRDGFSVNVIDANDENLSPDDLLARLSDLAPNIVGVSCMSVEYKQTSHACFEIAKSISSEIITIMGGVYPSISKDVAFKDENIDYLVVGEGEERLPNLIRAINSSSGFQNVDGIMYRENGKVINNPQNSVGIDDFSVLTVHNSINILKPTGRINCAN
jgi:radical SAM superfamily enzyme YgiQ (UPF0313 family)